MKRALSSYVIIKSSFDAGEDYIGAFIPLVVQLFSEKNYSRVDVETICMDFTNEYGIRLPRHPMETIINRMKPQYLMKEGSKIIINKDEIRKRARKIDYRKEMRRYDWLLNNFIDFCKTFQTPIVITYDEADLLFTDFLKEHDVDIVFALYGDEEMPELPQDTRVGDPEKKYMVNRYVNLLMHQGGEYAEYLIDSAIGHNYASTILFREFSNIRGKGTCDNYYLDVGILFDVTGVNGAFRKKASEDFLVMLRNKGSSLFVFRHNHEEFLRIIENCLNWIDKNDFNPKRASRALNFFRDAGYSNAEVQLFIDGIPEILENNGIIIINIPDPNLDQVYQIGREVLQRVILEIYNSEGHVFDVDEKEYTLERDITSIESIYKLRKGVAATNLNNAKHVFITTNPGLAYASAKFERSEMKRGYFTIPSVLTDTFVGTVIWTQEPTRIVEEFNRSKLIAYTNAAIQPRATLMSKFAQEVEKAKNNAINPIKEESALSLLGSNLSRSLLADKTLGNPDRITAQTPYELMEELKKALVIEERTKTEEAIRASKIDRASKEIAEQKLSLQTTNIIHVIERAAFWIKWFAITIVFIIVIIFGLAGILNPTSLVMRLINGAIACLGLLTGFSIFAFGGKIEKYIRDFLINHLIKSENKKE